jgi:hypothetical protein
MEYRSLRWHTPAAVQDAVTSAGEIWDLKYMKLVITDVMSVARVLADMEVRCAPFCRWCLVVMFTPGTDTLTESSIGMSSMYFFIGRSSPT